MTRFGYFLSSEEHTPRELVRQARLAEQAGFEKLWISDHFHPWLDKQGNEQERLPACLAALGGTAVIVVADARTDRTAEVARRCGAIVIEVAARNVGAARAAGVRDLLHRGVSWVATTDADTLVPPGWITDQLRYAARGWDAIAGTVTVADWSDHPPRRPAAYARRYAGDSPIHGANLGFTAQAPRCRRSGFEVSVVFGLQHVEEPGQPTRANPDGMVVGDRTQPAQLAGKWVSLTGCAVAGRGRRRCHRC